jgi:hypothetical protein
MFEVSDVEQGVLIKRIGDTRGPFKIIGRDRKGLEVAAGKST